LNAVPWGKMFKAAKVAIKAIGVGKRLVEGSSTCAGLPWASATSPTTSPAACSKPAASDRCYTLICDEPV